MAAENESRTNEPPRGADRRSRPRHSRLRTHETRNPGDTPCTAQPQSRNRARDGHTTETDPSWQRNWALLNGFRAEIHVVGAGHEDFNDNAGFIDALGPNAKYPPDPIGPIAPARANAATRQVLTAFFDRFLRGRPAGTAMLDNPELFNPDLQRLG